jgi:translation initiation factor IF-2
MHDENGKNVEKAGLSQAVRVMGWKEIPNAGDEVLQVETEQRAKQIVELREKIDMIRKQKQDAEIIKAKMNEHQQYYKTKLKERRLVGQSRVNFEELREAQNLSGQKRGILFQNK